MAMLPKASILYKMNLFTAYKSSNFNINSRFIWVSKLFNKENIVFNQLATDSFLAILYQVCSIQYALGSNPFLYFIERFVRCKQQHQPLFCTRSSNIHVLFIKASSPKFWDISDHHTSISSPLKAFIVEPHIKSPPAIQANLLVIECGKC